MSKKIKPDQVPLIMMTNERTPQKAQMMFMLYQAAETAQLAYMDGMDPESGEIHPLLVGLEPTPGGEFRVWPLARLINKVDSIPKYMVPDGEGNYIDYGVTGESAGSDDAGTSLAFPEEERQTEEVPAGPDGDGRALGGDVDPPLQ